MIGIIGAMQVEINLILDKMSNVIETKHGIRTFYEGDLNDKKVVVALAGIGKVNAGVTTVLLIDKYHPEYIINVGVAGGQNGVKHNDVVISSEVLYHDVNVTSFGNYVHGEVPGHEPFFVADQELLMKTDAILKTLNIDHKIGKIATGDQFVYSKESVTEVNALYNDIYAIEMEAGAIAHVASMYKIPFIVYRSISDVLDDDTQHDDFYTFVEEASEKAALVLLELINTL